MIFNLSFGAVPTWRPPSEVTDDTDDITREAKRRRLSQMLTSNMRREYEQTSSNCARWEVADKRAAFEWLVGALAKWPLEYWTWGKLSTYCR